MLVIAIKRMPIFRLKTLWKVYHLETRIFDFKLVCYCIFEFSNKKKASLLNIHVLCVASFWRFGRSSKTKKIT